MITDKKNFKELEKHILFGMEFEDVLKKQLDVIEKLKQDYCDLMTSVGTLRAIKKRIKMTNGVIGCASIDDEAINYLDRYLTSLDQLHAGYFEVMSDAIEKLKVDNNEDKDDLTEELGEFSAVLDGTKSVFDMLKDR